MSVRTRPAHRRHTVAPLVTALSVVALGPAAALAWPVIDDLETSGPLTLTADGATESDSSSAVWPGHCIAPYRTVHLTSFVAGAGGTLVTHLPYTAPNDVMDIALGPGGGSCVLEYLPVAPADLTDSGLNDRVEVDFQVATTGGTVQLSVWDQGGGFISHSNPASSGPVTFPFSVWAGAVNPTQVVRLEVRVVNGQQSLYVITDIRCARDASVLRFDASDLVAAGPPYPLPWFDFQVSDDNGPVERMSLRLEDALTVRGMPLGVSVACADDGGDVGTFGETAYVSATWDGAGAWEDSGIKLPVDFSSVMGVEPEPFLPELPEITPTSGGFLLSFEVRRQDSDGMIVSTSRRQMSFDVPAGQGVMGINPCCTPPVAARTGFVPGYTGFVLDFDLVATGAGVDPGELLFEAIVTGDCAPATATGVTPPAPVVTRGAALAARPSVTRAATELVLGAPARAGQAIELFDVAGRLVRRLHVAAGASSAAWDGSSAGGSAVPAGVYFARAGRDATARVVVVR